MNVRDAMERRIRFWKRQIPNEILASIGVRSPHPRPSRWEQYVRDRGIKRDCCYKRPPLFEDLGDLFEQYEVRLGNAFDPDAAKTVHDDSVPLPIFGPTVHFGEGVIGAFFGGELIFSSTDIKTESVSRPVVMDWAQLDSLRFDESNPWLRRVLDCLHYFVDRGQRRFALQPYCTIDSLNFVVVMRGTTQAYIDVVTDEPEVRRLMERGLNTTVRYWGLQRAIIEENNQSVIEHDEYAALCQAHAMPGLSVDAYGLCHPSVYDAIGLEYTQRLIDALGGGYLHVHSIGAHLVPLVARLDGLTELSLADDPYYERYFPKLRQMRECTGDLPLQVHCTIDEFTAGLRDGALPGGVNYVVQGGVDSVDEANRLMEKVRAYRA